MIKIPAILPRKNESLSRYIKRAHYAIRRRIIPSVRQTCRLERLVGPIGYWEALQAYQFAFLKSMGLEPHHTLLDIGCGPLQGGIKLIEYLEPNRYVGVDLRHDPIIEAYKQVARFQLVHKNPTLIVSDSFGKDELTGRAFDFFWISQLLYHLPLELIETMFRHIITQMTPTSVFYGDIIDYKVKSDQEGYWQEFKFIRHQPEDLIRIAEKTGLTIDILGQIGDFGYPKDLELRKNYVLKISPRIPSGITIPSVQEAEVLQKSY